MCDHCHNIIGLDCPVCSKPDRAEAVIEEVTVKVAHCKMCPLSVYASFQYWEQYDCNHPAFDVPRRVLISYIDEDKGVDDKPLPNNCPLRKSIINISL